MSVDSITIRLLNKDEYYLWDIFVNECKYGTIFNSTFWLKNLLNYKNIQFKILAVFDANKEIVAGFAFGQKNKFGVFKIVVPTPYTPYNGILIKEKKSKYQSKIESFNFKILNYINKFLLSNYKYISISFSPDYNDIRPFSWNNYNTKILYTYRLKLENLSNIFDNFDSDIKRRIKKAKQLSYEIKVENNQHSIKTFYQLQNLSFEKQKHQFNLSEEEFINFMQGIFKKNAARIYTIYTDDSVPVASCVVLLSNNTAYYWLAGSNPNFLNTGFNQLLFWEMLNDLSENKIERFDFMGANTNSIARYKSTYNFTLTPYYSATIVNGFIPKILFSVKNILND